MNITALSSAAPMGMLNRFRYNGKELDTDFDLGWYNFGARMHDPQIARFTTIDPLSNDYSFQSPYVYAANNPIRFIDYNGESAQNPDPPFKAWREYRSKTNDIILNRITPRQRTSINFSFAVISIAPGASAVSKFIGSSLGLYKSVVETAEDPSSFNMSGLANSFINNQSSLFEPLFEAAGNGELAGAAGVAGKVTNGLSVVMSLIDDIEATEMETLQEFTFAMAKSTFKGASMNGDGSLFRLKGGGEFGSAKEAAFHMNAMFLAVLNQFQSTEFNREDYESILLESQDDIRAFYNKLINDSGNNE